jgi:hypothetical protein
MKIAYYPETDSMYIDLSSKESVESTEISPGLVLDFDSDGKRAFTAGKKALTANVDRRCPFENRVREVAG